jgi:hypothetical protein
MRKFGSVRVFLLSICFKQQHSEKEIAVLELDCSRACGIDSRSMDTHKHTYCIVAYRLYIRDRKVLEPVQ